MGNRFVICFFNLVFETNIVCWLLVFGFEWKNELMYHTPIHLLYLSNKSKIELILETPEE